MIWLNCNVGIIAVEVAWLAAHLSTGMVSGPKSLTLCLSRDRREPADGGGGMTQTQSFLYELFISYA